MNKDIYDKFDEYFEGDVDLNDSEAHQAVVKLQGVESRNTWDWVFLATFIGLMLQMLLFSFATRINVAFYWIFAIVGVVVLILGVILSNIWQEVAANPVFSETITRFPITNSLLGTYYPMVVVAMLFLGMIVLFGKPPKGDEQ